MAHFYGNYLHFVLMVSLFLSIRIECIIHKRKYTGNESLQELKNCAAYLKDITYANIKELASCSRLQKFAWQLKKVYSSVEKLRESPDTVLASEPEYLQKAANSIPVTEINILLKKYMKTRDILSTKSFGDTQEELLDELQCQNFWNAIEAIQLEEMTSSTWIQRIKNVNVGLDLDFWDFFKTS